MLASTITMPAPIATFFQAFMIPVTSGGLISQRANSRQIDYLATKTASASGQVTDTHLLLRSRLGESSRPTVKKSGRDPLLWAMIVTAPQLHIIALLSGICSPSLGYGG